MKKTGLVVLSLLSPSLAQAGGVYVGEAGSQAMERAGAFVAKADDPTALSMNPAGLVKSRRAEIYLGANLLDYSLTYQRFGDYPAQANARAAYANGATPYPKVSNNAAFQPIPYVAASQRIGNLAIGEGFYANGAVPNRNFPCQVDEYCQMGTDGEPLPTRYDVVKQDVVVGYPSLALAYRVHPRLDIGVRASWGFATIKARNFPWALPNPSEDPTREGDFDAQAKDMFMPSFGAGVLFRPADFLEFGAAYSSASHVRAMGTGNARLGPNAGFLPGDQVFIVPRDDSEALCAPGGTTAALKTCINFDLPQIVTAGGRFIFRDGLGGERGDIEIDGRWENWSKASDDTIIVDGRDSLGVFRNGLQPVISRHGFKDVIAVRMGGAYKIDIKHDALTLRAGLAYDTAAAPTSWTRVDKDGRARATFAGGAAYQTGRWRFDAGIAVVVEGKLTVNDVALANPDDPTTHVQPDVLQPSLTDANRQYHPYNAGTYDSGYLVGMMGMTAAF